MKRVAPVVALCTLLLLGGAGAQAGGVVRDVGLEHFHPVAFQADHLQGGCGAGDAGTAEAGGGAFDRADGGTTIHFYERPPADDWPGALGGVYRDGYGSTGCGAATFPIDIPNGTGTVQVRFTGDRQIDGFDANVGAQLIQTVSLRYPAGNNATHEVFAPDAGPADMGPIVIPPFTAHHEGPAQVVWYFEDRGYSGLGQGSPNPVSGQDFRATVTDAVVSFSTTRPDLHTASVRDSRDGTQLTKEHRVDVDLPASEGAFSALHVKVAPGLDLDRVVAPDGTDLGPAQTYDGDGVLGQDQTYVVLELEEDGVLAMVPAPLTAAYGPGTYRFVFVERSGIEVSPALQPMSLILLATPLPFAVLAWMEARAFRKEAFGGFARSARNLQGGVVLVSLYYAAVVLSAALGGRLALMAVWPMPLEGLLLYVQVGLAVVAFTALWLVAREMFRMVWPRDESVAETAAGID